MSSQTQACTYEHIIGTQSPSIRFQMLKGGTGRVRMNEDTRKQSIKGLFSSLHLPQPGSWGANLSLLSLAPEMQNPPHSPALEEQNFWPSAEPGSRHAACTRSVAQRSLAHACGRATNHLLR